MSQDSRHTYRGQAKAPPPDMVARFVRFAVLEAMFLVLALLPGLLYLFVWNHGLSRDRHTLYLVGLIALHVAVTGLLVWRCRIIPAQGTDRRDAR